MTETPLSTPSRFAYLAERAAMMPEPPAPMTRTSTSSSAPSVLTTGSGAWANASEPPAWSRQSVTALRMPRLVIVAPATTSHATDCVSTMRPGMVLTAAFGMGAGMSVQAATLTSRMAESPTSTHTVTSPMYPCAVAV